MLPPAALDAADRLATALMVLLRAVAHIVTTDGTPTLPEAAAQALFFRLVRLVTRLVRISNFGVPSQTKPKPANPTPPRPAPVPPPTRPAPAARLPHRPGWLLAALPDIAPAVAADLRPLLADPAIATLLAASPTLHRTLRPLLRGLDLSITPPIPPPDSPPAKPDAPPPPNPSPPARQPRAADPQIKVSGSNLPVVSRPIRSVIGTTTTR